MPLALVVDDEKDICELISISLGRLGVDAFEANDIARAKELFAEHHFDICLTDMRLPDGDGLALVKHIKSQRPDCPVAVITAHGDMQTAVSALKAGAYDFVSKPVEVKILKQLVDTGLQLSDGSLDVANDNDGLIGNSVIMKKLRETIGKVADSQAPVHISGESGTGKELVARMIHGHSNRADKSFVPVNCGAIPAELMESEFFGYLKGSFTGANTDKQGLFQAADGGTLFLDEIADLPLHMQVKLLRVIQENSIRPIGSQQELPVDVRILSASHKNLGQLVKDEKFRQDLYYRVNVIEIKVPSLHERRDDVPLLADFILEKLTGHSHLQKPTISLSAMEALQGYSYPGNVRELENILERALALCSHNTVEVEDLQMQYAVSASSVEPVSATLPLEEQLESLEKQRIVEALETNRWNKTATAKALGMTFRALRYRLAKFDID
tara:strand:- start:11804 stop:13129 length:1326 start_codon:yes stop_codon:yes gene_type:complete